MEDYFVSDDKNLLQVDIIHDYLANQSYWAAGIPKSIVKKSIEGAVCFGVYKGTMQVGFARVITDSATFAYLADVFILEAHRKKGLSKLMIQTILAHPTLQGMRSWLLATEDAHGLYSQFGFRSLPVPQKYMKLSLKDSY